MYHVIQKHEPFNRIWDTVDTFAKAKVLADKYGEGFYVACDATTAEIVAHNAGGDGQCNFGELRALCTQYGAKVTYQDGYGTDTVRYEFADESAIIIAGDAWDIAACEQYCFEGGGCECGRPCGCDYECTCPDT